MHARLLHNAIAGATVVGLFDVSVESAEALAAELDVAVFDSAVKACACEADAVVICTPTPTHLAMIELAAAAGKAIFCEKPLSLDYSDFVAAIEIVSSAGVPFHIGFNRRFDPSHMRVRNAVVGGELGDLRQVHIVSRDPAPPPIDYITRSGGLFADMTIHDFDMALYITNSAITSVIATAAVMVDPAIAEAGDSDTASLLLTHKNGVVTTIQNCRQSAYGYDQRVEAFGSLGSAASENHQVDSAMLHTAAGSQRSGLKTFFVERYEESYARQWNQFIAALNGGVDDAAQLVDGEVGKASLLISLAAAQSVKEKRSVAISEVAT